MYICYLDESGTIEAGSTGTHFVLLGLAIPDVSWKSKDHEISAIKARFGLSDVEIHTGWMLRPYPEQKTITDFELLDFPDRRRAVESIRTLNLSRPRTNKAQRDLLKNYKKTSAYIHLTHAERLDVIRNLTDLIASWTDSRLFADAHDKRLSPAGYSFEFAFEQIVTRFNTFLAFAGNMGILVQDHNETVCRKLTEKMREFHRRGTFWSKIENIVETPLFVDSQLTSMVQIADICAYATRRFFENNETDIIERFYDRFDRTTKGKLVGLRHYTGSQSCSCRVCLDHQR